MIKNTMSLLLIVFVLVGKLPAQDRMPVINGQLFVWLEKIQPGSENDFGFSDRNEFHLAVLGSPIAVYRLNNNYQGDLKSGDTKAIVPTGEWRIPVLVGEESRMLITVVQIEKDWKIVDMGARDLAKEIAIVRKKSGLSNLVDLHWLRIHSLTCDLLFTGEEADSANLEFYPLESARTSLPELTVPQGSPTGFADLMPIIMQNQSLRIQENNER